MAVNIPTTATFATANMKPDPGEAIDSIWGRLIANNTGYLHYKPHKIASYGGYGIGIAGVNASGGFWSTDRTGTTEFFKDHFLNTVSGTCSGTNSTAGTVIAKVNGTTIVSFIGAATSFATAYTCNISGLVDNASSEVSVYVHGTVAAGGTIMSFFTKFDAWEKP